MRAQHIGLAMTLAVALYACSDPKISPQDTTVEDTASPDADVEMDADIEMDADVALDADTEPDTETDTTEPLAITGLRATQSAASVLAYTVKWSTSVASSTRLDVACEGLEPWTIADDEAASTSHEVVVLGLAAETSCTLTAMGTATDAPHPSGSDELAITVGALPDTFPEITLTPAEDESALAPGWTLINLSNRDIPVPYSVALIDAAGRYRWYYRYPTTDAGSDTPVIPWEDGVVIGGRGVPMTYVTWQGDIVWQGIWGHHEVRPSDTEGAFYTMQGFKCEGDDHDAGLIVEYDPIADENLWEWPLCEHYTPPDDVADWSHTNTVSLFPDENALIMSSRNQNAFFKINRDNGELEWVMGHAGWAERDDPFAGDFEMDEADRFYHQHDVQVLPNGHILLFDNGVSPIRPYSRALELAYTWNPDGTSEAHMVWEYRHDPDILANIWGGVQRLDNGNTLVCFGQRTTGDRTTIVEVSADAELLWQIQLPEHWGSYRAQKVAEPPRGLVIPSTD